MKFLSTAAILTSAITFSGCVVQDIEDAIEAEAESRARDSVYENADDAVVELDKVQITESEATDGASTEDEETEDETTDDETAEDETAEDETAEDDSSGSDEDDDLLEPEDVFDDTGLGDAFTQRFDDLYGTIDDLSSTAYTDPASLPTSGDAVYNGNLSIGPAIGEMALTADFGDASIGGTVENIIFPDDSALDGMLNISSAQGAIDPETDIATSYTFVADLEGTLSDLDGSYDVDGFMLGDFTGTEHEYIEGVVEGDVTFVETGDVDEIYGEFVGSR